ncbi:hypothetical protein KR044_013277, partial [Drosophila immigrans]
FEKVGSKYYYIPKNEKVTWYSAIHKCHRIGGQLISLADNVSLAEISEVIHHNKYPNFWLDLNDLGQEGEFVSISSGLGPSFVDWCEIETNSTNNSTNCVNIDYTNSSKPCMKSVSCLNFKSYICESQIPRTISIVLW